jgi:DNA-binding IclR family transcriptional regulator
MRIDDVLQRIQGEFVEMPGLRLTPAQAQRLWGLDRSKCEELLKVLVNANFLSQTRDGSFIRTDGGPRRVAPRTAA